jgi:alpha-D-xyloside xylohydrolase
MNLRTLALLTLLLIACSPAETTSTQSATPDSSGDGDSLSPGETTSDALAVPSTLSLSEGETTLDWSEVDGTLTLRQGGATRLVVSREDWTLGTVTSIDPSLSYDPYFYEFDELHPLYVGPEDLVWRSCEGMTLSASSPESLELQLTFSEGFAATAQVELDAQGRYTIHWTPTEQVDQIALFRIAATVHPEEGFYGLGEFFDDVNHRGRVRAMQFEYSEVESGYNEAHVPVPFLIGTTGWGFFAPSPYPSVFGVANHQADRVRFTVATGAASSAGLTFHLFSEDHPLDLTQHYYEVSGYPKLPAPWALGPWIWRDEVDGQLVVEEDLEKLRELDLATSGYWIDRPFASAVNSFDWHPDKYNDAPAMIEKANALGYRMAIWQAPYLHDSEESTAALLAEAEDKGYLPEIATTGGFKWGPTIDYTDPDAFDWWTSLIRFYTDMGIEGFKLDYAEDVAAVMVGFGVRLPWLFHDGSTELEMQSQFVRLYHDSYAATLPEDGGFLLCRSGTYGDQVNGVIVWPGDLAADMSLHGEEVSDGEGGTYKSVGGMPASMIGGLTLGPSGFPFYGSDTGGYRHAPPDKETYMRWFSQTALSTVMQVGTNSNDLPWAFGEDKVLDPEVLDAYRRYARLHMRLFPYVWTYAKALATDGRAIQRPLGLAYPELGVHPWDTYLLGDHLLVAPVVVAGATSREVILPPGQWTDWWTGETHEGGQTLTREAPLDVIPLFASAGAPVPMLRETIDTTAVASIEDVDSFGNDPGRLFIAVSPGPRTSFSVYDGTVVIQETTDERDGRTVTVSISPGEIFGQGAVIELYGLGSSSTPPTVRANGAHAARAEAREEIEPTEAGWVWSDARGGTAWIHAPAGSQAVSVFLANEGP